MTNDDATQTFNRGRRLSRSELIDGMRVVLHRLDKGLLVDTDAEAVVHDGGITFWRIQDADGSQELTVKEWDGDTVVHHQGKRFEVYESIKNG